METSNKQFDHLASISRTLAAAKRDMSPDDFATVPRQLIQLMQQYWPNTDMSSTLQGMQSISLSARDSSPSKRKGMEVTTATSHRIKRRSEFQKTREDALLNLGYSYSPMETEQDDNSSDGGGKLPDAHTPSAGTKDVVS
jgi:hypothetical protein